MSQLTVFVCGVTGTQGGVVARHLRAQGSQVHALARDPTSEKAKALATIGVKIWAGDYDNEDALKSAMAGCNAAFLNLTPDFQDLDHELRWARSIMAVAKAAGVKHFVYSSSLLVNHLESLKYWNPDTFIAKVLLSKNAIEAETRSAGFDTWTILRPASFMANYVRPLVLMYGDFIRSGKLVTGTTRDTLTPLVDTETIGRFTTAALTQPERFNRQDVEYADELMTLDQVMEKLSAAAGRKLEAVYLTDAQIEEQKATNIFAVAQQLSREMAKFVDMHKVRGWGVPLSSFDAFLAREKGVIAQTYD